MEEIIPKYNPKVSVIVCYWGDYAKYLDDCTKSVHNQTYKNYEIIVVDTETDLPTARNVGIRKAKGEYILCLDVDDTLFPTYLEETVGKDDIVSCGQQMTEDATDLWIPKEHPTYEDFLNHNQIHCCSLFKKEVWETIEGFDEEMKLGYEDYAFWLQALKAGFTVTTIQKPLFNYRRHGSTMIDNTTKHHEEIISYMLNKLK